MAGKRDAVGCGQAGAPHQAPAEDGPAARRPSPRPGRGQVRALGPAAAVARCTRVCPLSTERNSFIGRTITACSGYDAIEFAKLGRRTLGLDISTTAVARARRVAAQDDAAQALVDAGSLEFKVADLFTFPVPRDISGGSGYSVVFDYTLLPALPPDLWPQWASAMKRLVHPTKG